ncbi:DSBA oxidoreductase [Gordonia bronchialis DSM 43247]|uniref:DSBA oxidoreductase n=1 Tax=Gordonia bronchialis (strain ATCC 25592 / DSM 43247 / BCRC 13721 / JCM 3198 / KCTC 3076 / NBRC 16047 / NCTC 10667) TaxID=526226 RepID=D0LEY5_GORB4|nr:thioredoxin [Gordonia bronchialis]ACY21859.1 DSBA oxidoreductase [Gordonia bronchialis DSM 43247]MCC3324645.1 thioredoxin [Gordonia bronchialis]QGS24546.1 thioredoxin [Gordonia bronchialis]STQ64753.1 Protein-disulfide isomerase [Gordonia bronchialis]
MSRNVRMSLAAVFVFCLALTVVFVVSRAGESEQSGDQASMTARPDSPRLSAPAESKATFVEFLDFECEGCGAAYPAVEQLRQTYGDQVTFVVRYFPLPGHFNADRAARAVAAAAEQGQFEPMYRKMFDTQRSWGEQRVPLDDLFFSYARELGLNMERFAAAYDSQATRELIDRDVADGKALGVTGTPTFFINDERIKPEGYDDLSSALESAIRQ